MCQRILQAQVHCPISPFHAMGELAVHLVTETFVGLCPWIRRWQQTVFVNRRWTHEAEAGVRTLVLMSAVRELLWGETVLWAIYGSARRRVSAVALASTQGCVAIFCEPWWPQVCPSIANVSLSMVEVRAGHNLPCWRITDHQTRQETAFAILSHWTVRLFFKAAMDMLC